MFLLVVVCFLLFAFVLLHSCVGNANKEKENTMDSTDGLVIPFVIENRRMMVEATINGKSGKFEFDTGAEISLIPEARGGFPLFGLGYNGKRFYLLPTYRVRSVEFANGAVRAKSELVKKYHLPLVEDDEDGILGNGIFAGYWVEMSFSRNEIVLHREIPERFERAAHVPLLARNRFIQEIKFSINIDGEEVPFVIDTGLPYALFFPGYISEGMSGDALRRVVSSNDRDQIVHYPIMQTKSIKILDVTFDDKFVVGNSYIGERRSGKKVGLMGLDFMQHYDFLFDYRREAYNGSPEGMRFIPLRAPEERDYGVYSFWETVPEFGIIRVASTQKEGIVIRELLADSEAYALGLRPDSVITQLDGESAASFSPDEIANPYFYDRFTEFTARIDGVEVTLRRER